MDGTNILINKSIVTNLRKFGAILGDDVQTGCNSVTNPGTLWAKKASVILAPMSLVFTRKWYCQTWRACYNCWKCLKFFLLIRQLLEKHLESLLSTVGKSPLGGACAFALQNGGRRIRPALVLIISEAFGKGAKPLDAACAAEYSHTASLIADDLPIMDNAMMRRNKPALHIATNKTPQSLATYALISQGYDLIRKEAAQCKWRADLIFQMAIENATYNTGIDGATGGHIDLFPGEMSEAKASELMRKKTGTLFELSFVFGWLFGGGEISELQVGKRWPIILVTVSIDR